MSNSIITSPDNIEDIDLADAEVHRSGLALDVFKRLRRDSQVRWNTSRGAWGPFWSITRHEDIIEISRNPTIFSNCFDFKIVPAKSDESILYEQMGKTLLNLDPPQHMRLRRLVTDGFAPRLIRSQESEIRMIIRAVVNDVCERESCDFSLDVAAKVPIAIVCNKLGIPQPEWPQVFGLMQDVIGGDDGGTDQARQATALNDLLGYLGSIVDRAHAGEGATMVLRLTSAEIDGDRLTNEELVWFLALLVIAGNESTRNSMCGGIEAFAAYPEQRDLFVSNPSLCDIAVEEVIRWVTPIGHMARVATRDTEVRGVTITAGQRLVMWYMSANRDEAVYANPDQFDITRNPNPHLGFGTGEHFCLGSSLARLELKLLFQEVLTRLPDIRPGQPATRLLSHTFNGWRSMPVEFSPSRPLQ
jgi:cytochrome P450